jgi:predicted phosphoadenosine phosphosulfate sulfurtransferase
VSANGLKVYSSLTVYEKSLNRIRWIFDEFPEVVVSFSGGKDSTVIFNLAKIVAREKNRLPLKVFWLDQECELQATEDMVRKVMYDPDVEPLWYQIPFRMQNATSATDQWLNCWEPGEEWARDQDPISIKENTFGTDRFYRLNEEIIKQSFEGPVAVLTGVRGEESPRRMMGMTTNPTYKGETWGKRLDAKAHKYNFHPIYDWAYSDVWKAIHSNGWDYNTHYDAMFQYGVRVRDMRVSNYFHETAVHALFMLQEIEPETWERATKRISGLDTAGKMGKDDWFVYELPFMFTSWAEYRDYLLENLILVPEYRKAFADFFLFMERDFSRSIGNDMYKTQVNAILCNDFELTKLKNWCASGFKDKKLDKLEAIDELRRAKSASND